jgi:hypothetical protein
MGLPERRDRISNTTIKIMELEHPRSVEEYKQCAFKARAVVDYIDEIAPDNTAGAVQIHTLLFIRNHDGCTNEDLHSNSIGWIFDDKKVGERKISEALAVLRNNGKIKTITVGNIQRHHLVNDESH